MHWNGKHCQLVADIEQWKVYISHAHKFKKPKKKKIDVSQALNLKENIKSKRCKLHMHARVKSGNCLANLSFTQTKNT